MKKLTFAVVGLTALSLAACDSGDREDMVEERDDTQIEQMEEREDALDDAGMDQEAEQMEERIEAADDQADENEEMAEEMDGDL